MSSKSLPTLFLRLFLPIAILIAAGAFFYGQAEIERELARLKGQETLNVGLGAGTLSRNLDSITRDLHFLESHSALRQAVDAPTPQNINHLAEDLANFSLGKGIYDQVRWIDETGMEIVRIDSVKGKAVVISSDRLQNKGQRYFFTDTFKLNPGLIFVSPLDLNIEQDKIEVPHKAMLRVATPVANSRGAKRGIVILNYYGRVMLDSFAQATAEIADHAMVVNRDGYWLKSPKPEEEWGFMFKRADLSLAARAPAAWDLIRSADSGQQVMDDGLWTWASVYPLLAGQRTSTGASEAFVPSEGQLEAKQYVWKSVAHLSGDVLSALRQAIWLRLAAVAAVLLGLLGFGSWKLARAWRALASSEEDVRRLNAALEQEVDQRTQELRIKVSELDAEISGHKQAEAALRASEEKFAKAFRSSPVFISISTVADGRYVDVNEGFLRGTGHIREEVIGRTALEIGLWKDARDRTRAIDSLLNNDRIVRFEAELCKKSGESMACEIWAEPIAIEEQSCVIWVTNDITERKRGERFLALEHAIAHSLAVEEDTSSGLKAVIRAICEVNSWARGTYWRVDEMAGVMRFDEWWNSPDLDFSRYTEHSRNLVFAPGVGLVGRVWQTGEPIWTADFANDRRAAQKALASESGMRGMLVFPVMSEGRTIGALSFVSREVREPDERLLALTRVIGSELGQFLQRKQAEAQVRRLNADLERRVASRTRALEVANKELEAFSYSVSHDLRAPLRAIQGFSSLVEKQYAGQLDEQGRDMLRRVGAGALKMGLLIDDLLKLSQISRQAMQIGLIDLSALAWEVAGELQVETPERKVEWVIAPEVSAEGDPGLLRAALQNLMGNAWKYSSKRADARIEFGVCERNGRPTYFVRDNGAGFDAAYVDRLFGAFQRLHSPGEFSGTGIGLATVKRIIHRHGGEVGAEGKEGEGATFYFTL